MKLTIINKHNRFHNRFQIMNGNQEFCTTRRRELAALIVQTFEDYNFEDQFSKIPTIENVLEAVKSTTFIDLTTNLLLNRDAVNARFIFCKICKELGYTDENISNYIHRDRSSIGYAVSKFNNYVETDSFLKNLYLETKIKLRI